MAALKIFYKALRE